MFFDDKLDIPGTREGEGYKILILYKMIENIKSSVFNVIDFVITYFIVLYSKINIYFVVA